MKQFFTAQLLKKDCFVFFGMVGKCAYSGRMKRFGIIFLMTMVAFCQSGVALEFSMRGDRVWMTAKDASVVEVLQAFRGCGVDVLVDPSLQLAKVSGSWENTKTDRFVEQISGKYSYLLKWRKLKGPLGSLYQLASIKIYSPKNPERAKPLLKKERVLDVVTGTNGVQYLRGEVLVGFSGDASVKDLNALLKKVSGTHGLFIWIQYRRIIMEKGLFEFAAISSTNPGRVG